MPALQLALPERSCVVRRVLPVCLIYGILSGLRWPQAYALSHMVIDYHFGFGKRGLLGAVLHLIDRPPYHYATLACMAFALFAAWLAALGFLTRKPSKSDPGLQLALAAFFLSAGFASLVCDVGRGEHFGLLACALCLLAPIRPALIPFRAALLCAAILAQEINALIILPVVAFDVWLGSRAHPAFRRAGHVIATTMPAVLLTWYLGNLTTACDPAVALPYFRHLAADFTFQDGTAATLCRDGHANVIAASVYLWSATGAWFEIPPALIVAVPSTLFNLGLAFRAFKGRPLTAAAAVLASVSPLALLYVGSDVVRFVTLLQVTSLLVLISTVRRLGVPDPLPTAPARPVLAFALIAFQLGTSVTLTDGEQMLKFPFMPLVARSVAILRGREPFLVIPAR